MEISVLRRGKVKVNEGWCVLRREGVEIWMFDLVAKYAEATGTAWGPEDHTVQVFIEAGERTLHLDEDAEFNTTVIDFHTPWKDHDTIIRCLAEVSRYTLTVVLWVDDGEHAEVLGDL